MHKLIRTLNMESSIVQKLEEVNLYTVSGVLNSDLSKLGFVLKSNFT